MRNNANALIACGLLAFCGFSAYQVMDLPDGVNDFWSYGLSYFPLLATLVLTFLSLILLVRSILLPEPNAKIATGSTLGWMAGFALLMFLYAFFYERIGFIIASSVFMIAGMLILRERRILHIAVYPMLILAMAYFGFTKLMMVPLP